MNWLGATLFLAIGGVLLRFARNIQNWMVGKMLLGDKVARGVMFPEYVRSNAYLVSLRVIGSASLLGGVVIAWKAFG